MFSWLFQAADFMPHGMCLLWRPELMVLHVVADAMIAAAYFAIPIGIAVFVHRRPDLNVQHKALAVLFATFITACGLTHAMSILVLWRPYYMAEGVLKAITAVVSVATGMALVYLIPQLLRIPSPRALAAEIEAHKATLAELSAARRQLAARVTEAEGDLIETTRRFKAALTGSPVTVFEQDENLTFTWAFNPGLNLGAEQLVGRTDTDFLSPDSAEAVQSIKRAALERNALQRGEVLVTSGGTSAWFDMRVEPITLRGGDRGIIATATDITPLKRHQEHLNIVLHELNHRAKNLLTVVIGIVRQTGRYHDDPEDFMDRLQERLASLASAHDVLTVDNWSGADLRSIIQGQLQHQLQTFGGRVSITGPDCSLPAEGAHYVAMALHELGSNAVKYGALSGDEGTVAIDWTLTGPADSAELRLEWREATPEPIAIPTREGFGSRILRVLAPRAVHGEADLRFAERGVRWTLRAPLTGEALA